MDQPQMSRKRATAVLAGIMLGVLLTALDQTIVGTAMPRIISQLGGLSMYTWVTTAYMLASTASLPVFGKLSDMYGRRWFYIGGVALFMGASALCGLAQNIEMLILFRGLQGLAGGMMMGNSMALVGDLFPPSERGKYQGLIVSVFGIASIFGPTLGGYLTDSLSWRWVFYVNLPVGFLALAVLWVALPRLQFATHRRSVDYLGASVMILAVVPMLLALVWGGQDYPWASPQIIGMFCFSAIMFALLIWIEKHAPEPILPLELFRNSIYSISVAVSFLLAIGMFGAIMFLPLFIQGVQGNTATQSGVVLTPMMLAVVISSILSGQIISRTGRYLAITVVGSAIVAAGCYLFSTMNVQTTNDDVVRYMVVSGIGLGITMPVFIIAAQNAFPHSLLGVVSSGLAFFRGIGASVGMAVMGTLLANKMMEQLAVRLPPELSGALSANAGTGMGEMQVLLDPDNLERLRATFAKMGPQGQDLFDKTLSGVRESMAVSIQQVFFIGFVLIVLATLLTVFLKEIPLRKDRGHTVTQAAEAAVPQANEKG